LSDSSSSSCIITGTSIEDRKKSRQEKRRRRIIKGVLNLNLAHNQQLDYFERVKRLIGYKDKRPKSDLRLRPSLGEERKSIQQVRSSNQPPSSRQQTPIMPNRPTPIKLGISQEKNPDLKHCLDLGKLKEDSAGRESQK
jgi:hypothetical protein